jgi:hypothetical protein
MSFIILHLARLTLCGLGIENGDQSWSDYDQRIRYVDALGVSIRTSRSAQLLPRPRPPSPMILRRAYDNFHVILSKLSKWVIKEPINALNSPNPLLRQMADAQCWASLIAYGSSTDFIDPDVHLTHCIYRIYQSRRRGLYRVGMGRPRIQMQRAGSDKRGGLKQGYSGSTTVGAGAREDGNHYGRISCPKPNFARNFGEEA